MAYFIDPLTSGMANFICGGGDASNNPKSTFLSAITYCMSYQVFKEH